MVSVALVASASRKSAAMIGYLTPVTTNRISDDGLLLNLFSGETKASDGSRFIIVLDESRTNEVDQIWERGGGKSAVDMRESNLGTSVRSGRIPMFLLAPNWHQANHLNDDKDTLCD